MIEMEMTKPEEAGLRVGAREFENFKRAAKKFCDWASEFCKTHARGRELIVAHLEISAAFLELCLDCAAGKIHERLLLDTSKGACALIGMNVPLSDQEDAIKNGVQVVKMEGEKAVLRTKPLAETTSKEIEIAYEPNRGKRSPERQVEVLQPTILEVKVTVPPFVHEGRRVRLRANTVLTDEECVELLRPFGVKAETIDQIKSEIAQARAASLQKAMRRQQLPPKA